MRQIKFRGKRKDGVWVFGDFFDTQHSTFCNYMPTIIENGGIAPSDFHLVDPDTVYQFTGLVDRNGKEIYEGDIMGRLFDDYNENTIILYHKGILCAKPIGKDKFRPLNTFNDCGWVRVDEGYNYNFQVIGNIHDNPELLDS